MRSRDRDRGWRYHPWLKLEPPTRLWPSALWNVLATALLAVALLVALRAGLARQAALDDTEARTRAVTEAHRAAAAAVGVR